MNARQIIRKVVEQAITQHRLQPVLKQCSCGQRMMKKSGHCTLEFLYQTHAAHLADEIAQQLASTETYKEENAPDY
jgi:hypothetical protein